MDRNPEGQRWRADSPPRARLRPPPVRALRRDRLLGALLGAPHRLVLVTGPPGCGKTTLLTQFADAAGETGATEPGGRATTVVWYQLDETDAGVAPLFGHLAHALAGALGSRPARTWDTVEAVVTDLEEVDDVGGGDVLLALDDLHLLAGTAAEQALGQVLDLAPPWLRVAAASRRPPRWNLSRLRVSGALFEVGADDLRFRPWEVERLFAELYAEPLPPGDLAQLTRGLEGWAAGLQLFHLATRGKPMGDRRRAVASLPARSKLVREYLTGNVLDELPAELRAFLVDTCVFGRLSAGLADALRSRHDSAELLAELEARQLFVEGDEEGTYRYHEVFRTYLEGRLVEREGQDGARAWSQRAAALLESDGRMVDALRAYSRAQDWAAVARVVEAAGPELADGSASWLDVVPSAVIEDDPWAMLAAARRAASTGRFVQALDLYARAERLPGSARAAEICRQERAALAGWVDPSAPPPEGWTGQLLASLRAEPLRCAALGSGADVDGGHPGQRLAAGAAALLAGNVAAAARRLSAAADDLEAGGAVVVTARVLLAVAGALGGGPRAPGDVGWVDELPELAEIAHQPWATWLTRAVRGLTGGAAGRREAYDVAQALDRQGDPWGSAAAQFLAALGEVLAGGTPSAALDDLCVRLRALDAGVLECWCRALHATASARLALGAGPVERDAAAAEAGAVTAAGARSGVPGAQIWGLTVQAQLAEASGDPATAAALMQQVTDVRRGGFDVVVPPLRITPGIADPVDARVSPVAARDDLAGGVEAGPGHGPGIGLGIGTGDVGRASPPHPAPGGATGAGTGAATGQDGDLVPEGPALPVPEDPAGPAPGGAAGRPSLRCFGGLTIEIGGRPVDVTAAKPRVRTALRVLAAHAGQPVHVETLVQALWPNGGPADGKRSLQVALSSLRRLLDEHGAGAASIVREGDAYLLALPPGAEADVVDFGTARDACRAAARRGDGAAAVAAGERALSLYGGDLLPEEGPAEWVVPLRRGLAQDATEVAVVVAEHAVALERWEVAVAACRRGLHIDHYSDALWRLLATAHERQGDLAAAAQTQERYLLVLRDLGVARR